MTEPMPLDSGVMFSLDRQELASDLSSSYPPDCLLAQAKLGGECFGWAAAVLDLEDRLLGNLHVHILRRS
jgi:hypothetical protein